MILFVVPTAIALAARPNRQPGAYAHLSTWRLVGSEIVDGVAHVLETVRRRAKGRTTLATSRTSASSDEHGLHRTGN